MAATASDENERIEMNESKKKVKFLCSHGGKILPRPADGLLKYVGGETRLVSVPRDITFSELKKRLREVLDGDMVMKYQLIEEDLDTLVSVKSDEDLKHMLHEYDRINHQSNSSPKLRTFLFPSFHHYYASTASKSNSHSLENRYIYAINNVSSNGGMIQKVQSSPSLYRPNSPRCHRPCRGLKEQRLGRPLSFGKIHGIDHCYTNACHYNRHETACNSPEQTLPHSPIHRLCLWD